MRINNNSVIKTFKVVYFFTFTILAISVFFGTVHLPIFLKSLEPAYIIAGTVSFLLLLNVLGHKYFEFDSVGEVLIIKNRSILYKSEKLADFPKTKLIGYRIKRGLIKRSLILKIRSNQRGIAELRFNITFLNKRKLNNLEHSLEKVLKKNERRNIHQKESVRIIASK